MNTVFSGDRKYRYTLVRIWDSTRPAVMFVGLNPSTADETKDDPTIRRCIGYAKAWGFGGLYMGNIFAYRATDPNDMKKQKDPTGPSNDVWLGIMANEASMVVAAWGAHGKFLNRGNEVRSKLLATRFFRLKQDGTVGRGSLHVLGLTKDGQPKHPLYLKKNLKPQEWRYVTSKPNDDRRTRRNGRKRHEISKAARSSR